MVLADDNGHGTQVAGTIAVLTDNGREVAGVAWSCAKILPVLVMALVDRKTRLLGGTPSIMRTVRIALSLQQWK